MKNCILVSILIVSSYLLTTQAAVMLTKSRALHFVLKIGNLKKNVEFFRDTLGMKVLRHEVFEQGCEAACNGPYDGKWSKTMIGYGPEDDHFVLELTYNYTIGMYKLGNDLQHIKISLQEPQYLKVKGESKDSTVSLISPDGYKFLIEKNSDPKVDKSDVIEVCLACKDLEESSKYWGGLLKMKENKDAPKTDKEAVFKYADDQASLRLRQIAMALDRGSAYGRIAFSCPSADLKPVQKASEDAKQTVLTPYLSLDTPGKATVQVVILADPNGHEICFVGDEGFRELSQVDPKANELIEKSIEEDKSEEWYQKKGIKKAKLEE